MIHKLLLSFFIISTVIGIFLFSPIQTKAQSIAISGRNVLLTITSTLGTPCSGWTSISYKVDAGGLVTLVNAIAAPATSYTLNLGPLSAGTHSIHIDFLNASQAGGGFFCVASQSLDIGFTVGSGGGVCGPFGCTPVICGPAAGVPSPTTPTSGLCNGSYVPGMTTVTFIPGLWKWGCYYCGPGSTASVCRLPSGPITCTAPGPAGGACGTANGTTRTTAPQYPSELCIMVGAASSVSGSGPWYWTCSGTNGGATASCSAQKSVTVSPTNGVCASTHYSCTSGTSGSQSTNGTFYWWNCTGSNGGRTASCSETPAVVNGICASTHYNCNAGTSGQQSGSSGSYSWTCFGSNGGRNASCSETVPVNGICGSANGTTLTSAPTTNLCSSGTQSSVSGSGPWSWSCGGSGGGYNAYCSANLYTPGPKVTLTASPTTVIEGQSSTLTWNATGPFWYPPRPCFFILSAPGLSPGYKASSGSESTGPLSYWPNGVQWYRLRCNGPGGDGEATVLITVVKACVPNQGNSCSSSPNNCGQRNSGTIQCNGSCSATTPSNAACTPDLVAAVPTISPSSGISVGQSVTLSSLISNIVSGPANRSFPNLFRINASVLINGSWLNSLAAGASANTTASYTPTSPGTFTVSACADNDTSWTGTITETNEGNNCSNNATFTAAACTTTLTPAFVTIDQGQSTTLSWSPSSSSCAFYACNFTDNVSYSGASGSRTVSPSTTSTYGLSCTGPYNPPPVGTVPVYTTVTVLVPTAAITANGQSSTARVNPANANNTLVAWSSTNSTSCSVTKNGAAWRNGLSSSGVTDSVTAQTIYAIDCVNSRGTHATGSVTVNVLASFEEF